MMTANDALNRFQREICPKLQIDSPELTLCLIDEINKLKKGDKNGNRNNITEEKKEG
jgi:hypothetical protein